ncbi:hypothetical protein, partial [Porphyromonas macacae]|uniref:hypothetical protein n=1 Tax=Porphyromonas macacae TaxID=28115 RepID=UPI001B7FC782
MFSLKPGNGTTQPSPPGRRGESTEKKKQQEPQQREFFSPGYGSSLKKLAATYSPTVTQYH